MRRVTTVAEAIRILEKRKKERERFKIDDFFLPSSCSHAQLSRASQMIESNRTPISRKILLFSCRSTFDPSFYVVFKSFLISMISVMALIINK